MGMILLIIVTGILVLIALVTLIIEISILYQDYRLFSLALLCDLGIVFATGYLFASVINNAVK